MEDKHHQSSAAADTMSTGALLRYMVKCLVPTIVLLVTLHWTIGPDAHAKKLEQFNQHRLQLQAVSLGNSHAQSFHFESMGLQGLHYFELNGDLIEAFQKAKRIFSTQTGIQYVLLPASPGTFQFTQEGTSIDYTRRRVNSRLNMPNPLMFADYELEELVRFLTHKLLPIEHVQQSLFSLVGYNTQATSIDSLKTGNCFQPLDQLTSVAVGINDMEEGIVGGYRRTLLKAECIASQASKNAHRRMKNITRSEGARSDIFQGNLEFTKAIAELAAVSGAHVLLIETPLTREYRESEAFDSLETRYREALATLRLHPNIWHIDAHDFFDKRVDSQRNRYFHDDSHLAFEGARTFSESLASQFKLTREQSSLTHRVDVLEPTTP